MTSHLNSWLNEAVNQKASDLFLSDGEPPTLKIYGVFKRIEESVLKREKLSEAIKEILPPKKLDKFLKGHEVDMGLDVPGCSRFRLNVFRHQTGETVAIRPIPYKIPTLNELGLPAVFNDIKRLQHGLVLITGPAGSGKSTTLAALIDTINRENERHIITIEDPIEYLIPNQRSMVHQREVGFHTSSFNEGLKNALRENPDVIVIGELRDLETIELALRASETGHLVLGTLHSGTAVQAITRLLDIFDSERQSLIRTQLAQSLQVICAQHLYKRIDETGMVLATEVLVATLAIRNIIRENRIQEIHGYMETGMHEQMHTFKQSVQALVDKNRIDPSCLVQSDEVGTIPVLPSFDI